MVLQKLSLENFQGIRDAVFAFPGGCSASIYGDNATGKTTVFNALTWLLFDRSSTGAKGFTPTTRGPEGELHNLDHRVTGEFITDKGEVLTLSKTFKEVWKKKRGSVEAELTGHVNEYAINGVPTKEKDFQLAVLSNCGGDAEKPKILTMPDYFPEQMRWDERRKILLEVCGDVSDDDVIQSNPELAELSEFLQIPGQSGGQYGIDEYRKIVTAQRRDINRQLDVLPARIDEASKQIDEEAIDVKAVKAGMQTCQKEIDRLMAEKANALAGDDTTAQIRRKINELEVALLAKKQEYLKATGDTSSKMHQKIADAEDTVRRYERQLADSRQALEDTKGHLERLKATREAVLAEFKQVSAIRWNPDAENCPTCGRRLPEDRIEDLREKFNLDRSNRIEAINRKGKATCSKEMIAADEKRIEELNAEVDSNADKVFEANKALMNLEADAFEIKPFESTDEYHQRKREIADLEVSLEDSSAAARKATEEADRALAGEKERMAEYQAMLAREAANDRQRKRIKELEAEQKKLAAEFDRTEKGLYLTDLFTRTKVSMLTERINAKFKTVSFQLFADQINGGLKETCEVLVPGEGGRMIPYAYANNAARINAGLEIIGTLSDHWGVRMPVIVDNAEAVTHMQKPDTQLIRLVVSEPDKTLRVELEEE